MRNNNKSIFQNLPTCSRTSASRLGYHRLPEATPIEGDQIGRTKTIPKSRVRLRSLKPFLVLVLVAVFATTFSFDMGTTVYAQSPADGESVFNANCGTCHSTGTNTIIGPGLSGLADRATSDGYIRDSIMNPGAVIVDGFPNIMPATLGASLSSDDLDDLIAYLGTFSTSGAGAPEPAVISAAASEGDAERGENLFTGPTRFENKAPACSACHSSSGIGALGGGTLGPDLTGAYNKLGEAMILWPETVAPMSPIFIERPLTEQEKTDLLAFFKSADITTRETTQVFQLFGLAVAGTLIIALFTHLIWRRRLRGVRKPMVGTTSLSGTDKGNIFKRLLTSLFWQESAS